MTKEEKEVKVLNVDKQEVIKRLEILGAKRISAGVQKMYVYDIQSIYTRFLDAKLYMYNDAHDYNNEICMSKLRSVFFEIDDLIDDDDRGNMYINTGKKTFTEILDFYSITELKKILNNEKIIGIIRKYDINPNKWVRLRNTNNETTITIKHIINNNLDSSNIQKVIETEMVVPSIEAGNNVLNQLGFVYRNYQEKERIGYILDDVEIDIDTWPKIPTYVEIENENTTKIKDTLRKLKLEKAEIVSCNTVEVYKKYGYDVLSYRELKFDGGKDE